MSELEKIIRDIIAAQGPISMAAYMELALQHPQYGYYRAHEEPFGRTGDFITAPEVSQMFGEMVGVWCVEAWKALNNPDPFALIELGPGRGTMMQDMLRATKNAGAFNDAKKLFLIETDELLRARQQKLLGPHLPQYIKDVENAPEMPMIVVANEFFDAFPVRQFENTFRGWAERMVTVEKETLAVALRPLNEAEVNLIPENLRDATPNTVFEFSPKAQAFMYELAKTLCARRGVALIIDYGYNAPSGSSTVQAVSRHAPVAIFERPGEVDLTAHVDFEALADAAREAGARVSAVIGQGEFLRNCGIEIRAESLKQRATPKQAVEIDSAFHRLTDDAQMGSMFKVMEVRGEV